MFKNGKWYGSAGRLRVVLIPVLYLAYKSKTLGNHPLFLYLHFLICQKAIIIYCLPILNVVAPKFLLRRVFVAVALLLEVGSRIRACLS